MSTTLERVQALAESIAAAGPEIEAARSVPVSIVDDLKAAGVFRMYVPASHGGDELAPLDAVQVLEVVDFVVERNDHGHGGSDAGHRRRV